MTMTYKELGPVGTRYVFRVREEGGSSFDVNAEVIPNVVMQGRRMYPGLALLPEVRTSLPADLLELMVYAFHEGDETEGATGDENGRVFYWALDPTPVFEEPPNEA
jgi:hypothetical protein